ncbi:ribokinase [Methylopila capsulata]|uniref:Ribokinase n=1 Tax=Methylopila capsulata TaxID=61654 RepID=A0A9W6IVY3_9HYPH|nr:ribokinase [Methylopila capsulata]MBM7852079.1 ribokinase [Methylopila capsulata]GLK56285.1 ribokinase [Methylopila capsulata]
MSAATVAVLGIFAADLTFRARRLPQLGETLLAEGFVLGAGGKGSNQAIAAAKAGAGAALITRIGADPFAAVARAEWAATGVDAGFVVTDRARPTGAAFIFVQSDGGENAIIVEPGAGGALSAEDVDAARGVIAGARVFLTQLEQPIEAARAGLRIARRAGVATLLNPAPAAPLDDDLLALCDYLTPNESEARALTGVAVVTLDDARRAGDALIARGVGCAVVTLGARGALVHGPGVSEIAPALDAGPVVETTGAGDCFAGAFAAALAEGRPPLDAARFGCAAAGLSVTRPGAGRSMPTRAEIDALLDRKPRLAPKPGLAPCD